MIILTFLSFNFCARKFSTTTSETITNSTTSSSPPTTTTTTSSSETTKTKTKKPDDLKPKRLLIHIPPNFRKVREQTTSFICGLDEAGRGSILGPLVLGAVAIPSHLEKEFSAQKITDSKKLSPQRRKTLYDWLSNHPEVCFGTLHISSAAIDYRRRMGENLNMIELNSSVELLKALHLKMNGTKWSHLYLDAVTNDTNYWAEAFQKHFLETKVIAEHEADSKFLVTGAASIVAKVERDNSVKNIEGIFGKELGSGYPGDEKSLGFIFSYLRNKMRLPGVIRQSWVTVSKMKASVEKEFKQIRSKDRISENNNENKNSKK